jgi:hypothetical protein
MLHRLEEDGDFPVISERVIGIPLADTFGDIAVWSERSPDSNTMTIRAYDTKEHIFVASLNTELNARVTAIGGTDAYFIARGRAWHWDLTSGHPLQPVTGPTPSKIGGDLVSATNPQAGTFWAIGSWRTFHMTPDGTTKRLMPDGMFALVNEPGSLVALAGAGGHVVRTIESGRDIKLDLPRNTSIASFAWGLDGALLVAASVEGRGVTPFGCRVPEGTCHPLGPALSNGMGQLNLESSSRGQLQAESPDWE